MNRGLALGVGAGVVLIGLFGFSGVSTDNLQYLLGAYRRSEPAFLAHDWFVSGTVSFHPAFELFVLWFLRMDQLKIGLFLWFAANAIALGVALAVLARAVSHRPVRWPAMACILALVLVGNNQGWGAYQLLTAQAMPAYMAYPPALIAVAMLIQRRFIATALAIAAVFVVHRGFAALLVPLLSLPFLATFPLQRRERVVVAVAAGILMLLLLPIVVQTQGFDAGQKDALRILFYARSPQHYAVQYSPLAIHLASLHLVLVALGSAVLISSRAVRIRVLAFIGSACLGFALGYVFLELWFVPDLVRLFPFRAYPLLVAVVVVTSTTVAFDDEAAPAHRSAAAILVASLLIFPWSATAALVLVAVALPAYWLLRRRESTPRIVLPMTVCACAVALLAGLWKTPPESPSQWPTPLGDLLSRAFERHVPEDAVLVVPPELPGIRIETRRAIVVDFKAFPVYGGEMLAWADRMHAITGVDPKAAKSLVRRRIHPWSAYKAGYNRRTLPDLLRAARHFEAGFALVHRGSVFERQATSRRILPVWGGAGLLLYDLGRFPA